MLIKNNNSIKWLGFLIFVTISTLLSRCSKSKNLTNHINCDGLITDTLGTGDSGRIYMPNAFSSNNDGLNDYCRPITQNISSIEFTLYDEDNKVVFTTNQLGEGWQAPYKIYSSTKYYYKIQAVTLNNNKIGACGEVYNLTCFPGNIEKSHWYFQDQFTLNGFTGTTNEQLNNCP
jgi:hypothetical protein